MEKLYTLEDIAEILRKSRKTVYMRWRQWKAEGRIKVALRVGNEWRFPESEIKRLVKSFIV